MEDRKMVGSALQSQSQPQPPSAEEEALKRNTDCVYFLASPLTCKKGNECEYRHSDVARVNPRDCYFWLHGNCLNPKCGFRHPPLDGLLGTQKPTSAGPSAPVSQTVAVPAPIGPNAASTMQGVPCVFFQKGYCLKGDWCPFLHVPNPSNTKALPVPGTTFVVEPANIKKPVSGVEKSVQQKVVPTNIARSVKGVSGAKPPVQYESAAPRNEFSVNRRAPQTSGVTEFSAHRSAPPVSNGNTVSWSNRVQHPHLFEEPESMTSKDVEEVSREHSPGFDVLVDDEGRDSDFYAGEDMYGMPREDKMEYDNDHPTDYNMVTAVDDERYDDHRGFDHRKGQYAWEQHRVSSGGSYREKRPYSRPDDLGQVEESDLRHHLAKHKKPNGLRSVITHEHARDMPVRDRSYQGLRDNSVRSRLRGRIGIPGRSVSPNNMDRNRSSDRGRLSPVRASHQGRIQDRIRGRVEEAYNNGGRNYRGVQSRRDIVGENISDFSGPKSLAELKNRKDTEPNRQHATTDQHSLGKRRHSMLDGQQHSGNEVSFEGPKPLEEILKRKRRETTKTMNEDNIEAKNQEAGKGATNNESSPVQSTGAEESRQDTSHSSLQQPVESKLEAEDGEYRVDQEPEPYEQRDGESDYEQIGGEEYELSDAENGDAEGEYLEEEEDEDDDFAKKMGVV